MRGMLHDRGIQAIDCNERRHLRKTAVPVTATACVRACARARAISPTKLVAAIAKYQSTKIQTSLLAEWLSVGPRPAGLTNAFFCTDNLPSCGASVDSPIAQVSSCLMDLTVNGVAY